MNKANNPSTYYVGKYYSKSAGKYINVYDHYEDKEETLFDLLLPVVAPAIIAMVVFIVFMCLT